jgi:hypothetical protein
MGSDNTPRKYSQEEVNSILRRALERGGGGGSITHEELVATANELGIEVDQLEAAIVEQEEMGELDSARAEWLSKRKQSFFDHLRSYLIVNLVLFLVDMFTSGGVWFYWPLFGWGIGLLFDAAGTFFPKEREIDRGARRILERRARKVKKTSRSTPEKFSIEAKGGKLIIEKGNKKIELG